MRVQVRTLQEANAVVAKIANRLKNFNRKYNKAAYWKRLQPRLTGIQVNWWEDAFNVPFSNFTYRARQTRLGYYRLPKKGGVSFDEPGLSWTWKMRDSTAKLTRRAPLFAYVDTKANYRGRIPNPDPAQNIAVPRARQPLWNNETIDRNLEFTLEEWLDQEVLHALV